MLTELEGLQISNTLSTVVNLADRKFVGAKWVFTWKMDHARYLVTRKAIRIAQDYSQSGRV